MGLNNRMVLIGLGVIAVLVIFTGKGPLQTPVTDSPGWLSRSAGNRA